MKKRIYLIFIILTLLIMSIAFKKFNTIEEDIELRNKIIETVKTSDHIDFAEITDFEWDTMYIFTPYTAAASDLKEDGIKVYNSRFNIEYADSFNMIAFVKSNKLIAFVEIPREYGEFNTIYEDERPSNNKFNKKMSKFDILEKEKMIDFNK